MRAWVGMSQYSNGWDQLKIIATDPITPYGVGTQVCWCFEPCGGFVGPIGEVKLIAQYSYPPGNGAYGIFHNSWEGGKTVTLPDCIQVPYGIVANAVREMDTGIPTVSGVCATRMLICFVAAGCFVLRTRHQPRELKLAARQR